MTLKRLKPGLIVYDVRPATGHRRLADKWLVWPVRILEINTEKQEVLASWNRNRAEWYDARVWSKWRMKQPE